MNYTAYLRNDTCESILDYIIMIRCHPFPGRSEGKNLAFPDQTYYAFTANEVVV
jgi:hypothetical protein